MSNMAREDTKKVIIVNHTFKSVSNMNDKNDKSVCVKGLISKIGGCNVVVGTSKDICDIFPEIVGKVINEQKRKIHYVIFDEIHTINMNEGKEMEHIAKMIGNAVPVDLGKVIGASIRIHVEENYNGANAKI